jgi:hypothetical protein
MDKGGNGHCKKKNMFGTQYYFFATTQPFHRAHLKSLPHPNLLPLVEQQFLGRKE